MRRNLTQLSIVIPTARQNAETEENNGSEEPSSGSFASDEQVLAASGAFEEGCLYEVGDADANGKVDAADARIILRFAAKLDNYKGTLINVLDLNDDEKVNAADARIVLRCAARLDKHPGTQRFVYDCDLYKPKPGSNNNNNDGPSKYFDKPSKQYEDLSYFEYEVVRLVNIERAKEGLPPLEISYELTEIARQVSRYGKRSALQPLPRDKYGNEYGDGIAFELMQERGIRYKWLGRI